MQKYLYSLWFLVIFPISTAFFERSNVSTSFSKKIHIYNKLFPANGTCLFSHIHVTPKKQNQAHLEGCQVRDASLNCNYVQKYSIQSVTVSFATNLSRICFYLLCERNLLKPLEAIILISFLISPAHFQAGNKQEIVYFPLKT